MAVRRTLHNTLKILRVFVGRYAQSGQGKFYELMDLFDYYERKPIISTS